jgi:hypothetical protein
VATLLAMELKLDKSRREKQLVEFLGIAKGYICE